MGKASNRKLFREAIARVKEAKKLLRRARRRLGAELKEELGEAITKLTIARKGRDREAVESAIGVLDLLVEEHLAEHRKNAFREYTESIGMAVIFALILRAFVVEAFQIPSESMVPTLLVGDHLFVNKFVYGLRIPFTRYDLIDFGQPERGDVVVFIFPVEEVRTEDQILQIMLRLQQAASQSPDRSLPESLVEIEMGGVVDDWNVPFQYERTGPTTYDLVSAGPDGEFGTADDLTDENTALRPGQRTCLQRESMEEAKDYIKRVIGIAGDRIRVEDNIVYVNDEPIPREVLEWEGEPERRSGFPITRARETIGDTEYVVQYINAIPDFREITVREGYLFAMGDNRDNSSDSRCWGQVPVENVKGEALFLFWSGGDKDQFLGNRWERMLNGVE